jgi:hypothetical protein
MKTGRTTAIGRKIVLANQGLQSLRNIGNEAERAADEIERLRDALVRLQQWADAYPLDQFQEVLRQDWQRANALLAQNGISMSAMSASNMRHVLKGVRHLLTEALEPQHKSPASAASPAGMMAGSDGPESSKDAAVVPTLTDPGSVADHCRAMGLQVGDTIEGTEGAGARRRTTRLKLLWLGKTEAVWSETTRTRSEPDWTEPRECADWVLGCRDWFKIV